MRRSASLAILALFLLASLPALAGSGEHKKCPYPTQECLDHMAAHMKDSGWVGIEMDVDENTKVMTIKRVVPGSPAEAAGIQVGDVLYALNGVQITDDNEEALKKERKDWKPGQKVTYTIKRNGLDRQVNLTLAPMPADVMAAWIGNHMLEHVSSDVAELKKK
jgi:predicted metalloprotease with PDZ domain